MTWQGTGGTDDRQDPGPSEDETRTDWNVDAAPQPVPDAPPPLPAGPGPQSAPESPAAAPQAPAAPIEPPAAPPAPPLPPAGPPPAPAAPPPGYGAPSPGYGAPQGAPVAWAAPTAPYAPTGLEVPGAPGLRFGSTLHRVIAYWIDAIVVGIGAGILAGIAGAAAGGSSLTGVITAVVYLGLEFLYFVGLWTSGDRATLGMRIMKLQIGNAFDGRTLTMSQAAIRWVALGLPFQAASFIPELVLVGSLAGLWSLVLLISTAVSPTRQGIHDRVANSAIVQPIGASTPAVACLLLLLILVLLPLVAIIALIFLGSQVSTILSSVGTSVYP